MSNLLENTQARTELGGKRAIENTARASYGGKPAPSKLSQQHEQKQQASTWLFRASNDAPGTRERRSESDKAQAFL
jgi:hypothetical protein